MLVMPDHPTPLAIKTHTSEPVPYLLYSSRESFESGMSTYTEETAESTGEYVGEGFEMMKLLLGN